MNFRVGQRVRVSSNLFSIYGDEGEVSVSPYGEHSVLVLMKTGESFGEEVKFYNDEIEAVEE